ncbi:MAG: hypothetical protein LBJ00_15235 [Planctomycetaceae bacterium]|nr:hypothetical protein [Planctomycetaceae bacterium]
MQNQRIYASHVFELRGINCLRKSANEFQYGIVYTQAVLKFLKLDTQAQQREAVVQGRSLSPYRLRYTRYGLKTINNVTQTFTIR